MRLSLLFLAFAWCLAVSSARAQDATLPKPDTQDPTPAPAQTATPAPTPELIPADILPPPDPAATVPVPDIPTIEELDAAMTPPPLSPAAESMRLHIEWRKLRNQAQNDARVKAALADAEAAKTDLQRRKLLARYIEISFARMIALGAPEMKPYLLQRKAEQLATLPQPRVRPETALTTPAPAAQASASPSPAPTTSPTPASIMPRLPRL